MAEQRPSRMVKNKENCYSTPGWRQRGISGSESKDKSENVCAFCQMRMME